MMRYLLGVFVLMAGCAQVGETRPATLAPVAPTRRRPR